MERMIFFIGAMALFSSVGFAERKDTSRWENLQTLKAGQKVQILQEGSIVTEGKFQGVSDGDITIEVKKQTVVAKRVDVRRVVLKKGKTGHILVGLMIGMGIGSAVAMAAQGDEEYGAAIALPILVGGGAAVGAILPANSIVYERR